MNKWLAILCSAALGCSADSTATTDGGDASAVVDAATGDGAVGDGAVGDGAVGDGATPDLNPCPATYVNSGVCPDRGLVCRYFEAVCYCDSNAGMWFCCGKNSIAMCPPPSTPPPTAGSMCDEDYIVQPCQYDCVNGAATACSCVGCRWQCMTSACTPDGGIDGG